MDPLQPLYELFDELTVQKKPPLMDAGMPLEPPLSEPETHPVTQKKNEVDDYRKQGMDPVQSHQQVYGEVDTADVNSKAEFATTLGRVQSEKDKRGVKPEKGSGSMFSKEAEAEKVTNEVTPDDIKTPMDQQVPDRNQTPLDQTEEFDYNDDVSFLKKYGRA